MEVTGVYNPKSTPFTRKRDRAIANVLGSCHRIFTSQPALIGYVVIAFILAGIWENVYNP
jgi:hypothetical protein